MNNFPFVAPRMWQRIEALDGLLSTILTQLAEEPKDVAVASAVCRAWRHAASSERIWEEVCERSEFPLLKVLKAAPGCQMTWRQLFTQRMAARIASERTPAAVPEPARSDYLIGVELSVLNPGDQTRTPVHASTRELGSLDPQVLCSAENLTSPAFWDNDCRMQASLLLIRKSDSKVFELANRIEVNDGNYATSCSWFNECVYVDAMPRVGHGHVAELRLAVSDEATEHCSGKGPPTWEAEARGYRCSCGHLIRLKTQPFELRGWSLELHRDAPPDWYDAHQIESVDDLLRLVEGPGAAHRWA